MAEYTLQLNTPQPCRAMVGGGLIERLPKLLPQNAGVFIVTDENLVAAGWLSALQNALGECRACVLRPGEQEKRPEALFGSNGLCSQMFNAGLSKEGLVLALGGGVVCDIANFASAVWQRGVPCVMCPTTLMAMADAAFGGKCGLDFMEAKNQLGLVRQPRLVLCDTDTLATLPQQERALGMAEVIKCAAIASEELFVRLEQEQAIPAEELIYEALTVKRGYVEQDEFDVGPRRELNFGHTLGHALELAGGIAHGRAVAWGMIRAAELGEKLGVTQPGTRVRLSALLSRYGLGQIQSVDIALAQRALLHDKKGNGETVELVLLERIGRAQRLRLPLSAVAEELQKWN